MTNSTPFARSADKWASELWNVSLLPVGRASNDAGPGGPRLRLLENIDEGRSPESFRRPLVVEDEAVSVILR